MTALPDYEERPDVSAAAWRGTGADMSTQPLSDDLSNIHGRPTGPPAVPSIPPPIGESGGWGPYTRTQLARYRPDGTIETTWRPGVVAPPGPMAALVVGVAAVGVYLLGGPLLLLLLVGYLLPTIIAASRRADFWRFDAGQVSIVGVLAGWTGIGWVAALVMAVMKDRPAV